MTARGSAVSYESQAEPIKFGCVYDFKLPDSYPQDRYEDFGAALQLVFDEGLEHSSNTAARSIERNLTDLAAGEETRTIVSFRITKEGELCQDVTVTAMNHAPVTTRACVTATTSPLPPATDPLTPEPAPTEPAPIEPAPTEPQPQPTEPQPTLPAEPGPTPAASRVEPVSNATVDVVLIDSVREPPSTT